MFSTLFLKLVSNNLNLGNLIVFQTIALKSVIDALVCDEHGFPLFVFMHVVLLVTNDTDC